LLRESVCITALTLAATTGAPRNATARMVRAPCAVPWQYQDRPACFQTRCHFGLIDLSAARTHSLSEFRQASLHRPGPAAASSVQSLPYHIRSNAALPKLMVPSLSSHEKHYLPSNTPIAATQQSKSNLCAHQYRTNGIESAASALPMTFKSEPNRYEFHLTREAER